MQSNACAWFDENWEFHNGNSRIFLTYDLWHVWNPTEILSGVQFFCFALDLSKIKEATDFLWMKRHFSCAWRRSAPPWPLMGEQIHPQQRRTAHARQQRLRSASQRQQIAPWPSVAIGAVAACRHARVCCSRSNILRNWVKKLMNMIYYTLSLCSVMSWDYSRNEDSVKINPHKEPNQTSFGVFIEDNHEHEFKGWFAVFSITNPYKSAINQWQMCLPSAHNGWNILFEHSILRKKSPQSTIT